MRLMPRRGDAQDGSAYVEVLVAVMLVMACLVPALDALQTGIGSSDVSERFIKHKYKLQERIQTLLVEPFSLLDAEALVTGGATVVSPQFSDPGGSPDRLLVYLYRYDGDNADMDNNPDTGGDAGLLKLRVVIENGSHEVSTLIAE